MARKPAAPADDQTIANDQSKPDVLPVLTLGKDLFQEKFPLTFGALTKLDEQDIDTASIVLRVSAKSAGFRRGGISHSMAQTDHPLSAFSHPAQIEAILSEPALVAELTTAVETE